MVDPFYTPNELAEIMISFLPCEFSPKVIADFSSGEGSLLYAASKKWPEAEIIANDLSKKSCSLLRRGEPGWVVSCSNFLENNSISKAVVYQYKGEVDLVLLNPPFSQRGIKPVPWGKGGITSGVALAFLYRALDYLKSGGYAVAILPNGCLYSIRDKLAREYIYRNYCVDCVVENSDNSFLGVRANTSIVVVRNSKPEGKSFLDLRASGGARERIFRGKMQMHKIKRSHDFSGTPLVHTNSINNGLVAVDDSSKVLSDHIVDGPAILFPRVGNVTMGKVAILPEGERVVISDCIISFKCSSNDEALLIREKVLDNWLGFKRMYSGTGAQYVTVERVAVFFGQILAEGLSCFDGVSISKSVSVALEV